jgi:hypothetical protein
MPCEDVILSMIHCWRTIESIRDADWQDTPFHINVLKLNDPIILVQPEQAESTAWKNVILRWSPGIWDHWGLLEISHDSHKLFANLHAWKHRLDLPRRACKISQSLHSGGMTMGAPSQYCGTKHSWVLETCRSTTLNKIY